MRWSELCPHENNSRCPYLQETKGLFAQEPVFWCAQYGPDVPLQTLANTPRRNQRCLAEHGNCESEPA